jgi:hypothetical protein
MLLNIHTFLHNNITSEHNTFQLMNINKLIYFKTSILLTIRVCMAGRLQIASLTAVISLPMLYMVALWRQGVIAI